MQDPSLNNNRYFIFFIDDFTRMTWVYFMRHKSEVSSIFKRFKAMVENQSDEKIKILRSDRGTEYNSNEFEKFCAVAGIEQHTTVRYTPQQNGVSERKNRTVMEMARCMLAEKNLPKSFWAEAVNTAVYLLNRLPTRALKDKIPIEAWSGHKPTVKHLKVFGSMCYTHVPDQKRHRLEDKAERGIFVGYSSQSKGFKVYNIETKKVIISRDIKVDEDATWNWVEGKSERRQTVTTHTLPDPEPSQPTDPTNSDSDGESSTNSSESPPKKMRSLAEIYDCNRVVVEPHCYEEASQYEEWNVAMEEELKMIEKNQTWELTKRPFQKKVIGVKWIYRTKMNPDGTINKHKARLVAKGYSQEAGVDYSETFAPVARHDTIRILLALSAQKGWKIFQLDVKSAFLNGYLEEEVYIEQPEGYAIREKEDYVYKLKKALYGLKQAPRAWYSRIDNYFIESGFRRSPSEPTLYVKKVDSEDFLIVSLYVDDLLVTGSNPEEVQKFKADMKKEFEMSDLGEMNYFLGMEIHQSNDGIFICQKKYAEDILKKFKMEKCKPIATPLEANLKLSKEDGYASTDEKQFRSLVGSLLYLTATRPDLMYAASLLSRFMQSPSEAHFAAGKRILRYLRGTTDYGIFYKSNSTEDLKGYTDSDWAGSVDDMKSTSGYTFFIGSGAISWNSRKQETVAQSTAEAEYIAASSAVSQVIWIRKILSDLGCLTYGATTIYCDSKSAVAIAKNPVDHGRTKHIKVKYHFIREAEGTHQVSLIHCGSNEQVADIFTKPLPRDKFQHFRTALGMMSQRSKEEC